MSIAEKIKEHLDDKSLQPRTVIILNGESGSFFLPANVRLILRNSPDVRCTGSGGNNELSLEGCRSVSIEDFKNGVIRFETQQSPIQKLDAKNSRITVSSADIAQSVLTDCKTTLSRCTITGSLETKGGTLDSNACMYKVLAGGMGAKQGRITSVGDEIQQLISTAGCKVDLIKSKVTATVAIETGSLSIEDCEWDAKLTLVDSNVNIRKGKVKTLVMTNGTATLLEIEVDGACTISNGVVNIANSEIKGDLGIVEGSSVNVLDLDIQGGFTAENSTLVLQDVDIQGDLDLTDVDVRLKGVSVQGTTTYSGGAVQSDDCHFQGNVTGSEMTLDSESDDYDGNASFSSLVGPNLIRNADMRNGIFNGNDTATIVLEGVGSQQLNIASFSNATILDTQASQLEMEDVSKALIDECPNLGTGTIQQCGMVIIMDTSEFSQLEANQVQMLLTKGQSNITANNCGLFDEDSTIEATDCRGWTKGSTVTGTNNLLFNIGGSLDVSASVVVSKGGTVANPDGGISIGTGFDETTSSGAIVQDDDDMKIQAVGDITIKAGDDITIQAEGDVNIIS